MIKELEDVFIGTGEVDKFYFHKFKFTDKGYCYVVTTEDIVHYEVFEKKIVPLCIDFTNRIYSDVDFKEVYPKAKDFGIWAWTYKNEEDAIKKLNEL